MNSLKSKLVYQLAVSFFYCVIPIVVFPYVSRVLGPANIGKINFVDYISQFFILFASFGIPFYGAREVAKAKGRKEGLFQLTSELLAIHFLFTLVSLGFFAGFIFLKQDYFSEKGLVLLAMINLVSNTVSLDWFIGGLEDFKFLARRSLIVKIITVIFIFTIVKSYASYEWYYAILVGSNLLLLLIDLVYVLSKGKLVFRKLAITKHLRSLSIFFLTTITLSLYNYFDATILGLITGALAVGYYTTSLKIIRLSQNFINDLSSVLLPRFSYLIETGNHTEIQRLLNKSFLYVFTITLPLCFFLFSSSREIILALGGAKFYNSIAVLKILSLLPLIIGLGNIFFMQILLPYNKERIIFWGVLMGSVASIVSNLLLCPIYGEKGAAISCLVAEGIVAIFLGWRAMKLVQVSIRADLLFAILASCCLFYPISFVSRASFQNNLMALCCSAILCGGVYLIIQLTIFKNPIVQEVLQYFKRTLSRRKTDS